jgi:hypothetical protein
MSAEETIRCGRGREAYIRDGGRQNGKDDPVKIHGVKRLNCLYELEYWKVRDCRSHSLFLSHVDTVFSS